MAGVDVQSEWRRVEKYLTELEAANRKLAQEKATLRASTSYRLGLAFVRFAGKPGIGTFGRLIADLKDSVKPQKAMLPDLPKRPYIRMLAPERFVRDSLQAAVEEQPIGSSIAGNVEDSGGAVIVGFVGPEIEARLGSAVMHSVLPRDRYDLAWRSGAATHLVVDVDHLASIFGWEHSFTLNDTAATVEMAALLQKARQAGMTIVLIRPSQPYRYPLLSRVRSFFDTELARDEISIERLASAGRKARPARPVPA